MNNSLNIYFTDFWPDWKHENFILKILDEFNINYNITPYNPDILFYSIFGDNQLNYSCKKIMYTGEEIINYPYNDIIKNRIQRALDNANYTISFMPTNNKNFYLPIWIMHCLHDSNHIPNLINKTKHNNFTHTASFIVSNDVNLLRNMAFKEFSKYFDIQSYGKVFNNNKSLSNYNKFDYHRLNKEHFLLENTHKFDICYENHMHPKYITEKIMDAFLVGSIPIYWGPIKTNEWFNPKAYINTYQYNGNYLKDILNINKNKSLFDDIYNEPVFTDYQKNKILSYIDEFKHHLMRIINN